MKVRIRHPAGLEIDFEGEPDEFGLFTQFLADPPEAFVEAVSRPALPEHGGGGDGIGDEAGDPPLDPGSRRLDAQSVHQRFEAVGARTDVDRVAVITQAAAEAGLDGLDYPTIDALYSEMGLRKPAQWRQTFSNARRKGYVRNVAGKWRPTVAGENFARGHTPSRSRGQRKPTTAPEASLPAGRDFPRLAEGGGE